MDSLFYFYNFMKQTIFAVLLFIGTTYFFSCGSRKDAPKENQITKDSSSREIVKPKLIVDSSQFTRIKWIDSTFKDLGKVGGGDSIGIKYKFQNVGDNPLMIQSIKTSCGCTIANTTTKPIMPGKFGEIKAKFYSADQAVATHLKHIYVNTNTMPHTGTVLTFKAVVVD